MYSVIAINTDDVLADRANKLELLPFIIRPKIYSVIRYVLPFQGEDSNEYSV